MEESVERTGAGDLRVRVTHVCYNLDYVKRQVLKDHRRLYLTDERGEPATKEAILELVLHAMKQGYKVLPPCDNVDEEGRCKGHEKEEERLESITPT